MGEVWAAIVVETGQPIALKVLLDKAARNPDLVARFAREAKISERIKSPFVCDLIDAGRSVDGELYMVLELLHGESLAGRLRREQDLPFTEVERLIDDVLEGLVAAHAVGVVHRDLKPGNIFLERLEEGSERAKILDFGVSKLLSHDKWDERSLTAFDATLGSFAYMAPEQVRGAARVDERADIYAVGAVVFRTLSGRLAFEGTTASMLLSAKLDQEAPTLTQTTGVQWPAGIERFLARALNRKREERFSTAADALVEWRQLSANHSRAIAAGRASVNWEDESQSAIFFPKIPTS